MSTPLRSTAQCPVKGCKRVAAVRINPDAIRTDTDWLSWVVTVACPREGCDGIITVTWDSLKEAA